MPQTPPTQSHFELADAFTTASCPVCLLVERSVSHYMGAINYDSVMDPGFQKGFLDAGGFCTVHAWMWLRTAFILGTATLYRELLQQQPSGEAAGDTSAGGLLGRWLRPAAADETAMCPACVWQEETTDLVTGTLVRDLRNPDFAGAFRTSAGLCRPHLQGALRHRDCGSKGRTILLDDAAEREASLIGELDEVIRKHDYRFSHEGFGPEHDAAERVIRFAAGFEGMTTPRRR